MVPGRPCSGGQEVRRLKEESLLKVWRLGVHHDVRDEGKMKKCDRWEERGCHMGQRANKEDITDVRSVFASTQI